MSIQEEVHKAIQDIQEKVSKNIDLKVDELETLFLASLIEDEGSL